MMGHDFDPTRVKPSRMNEFKDCQNIIIVVIKNNPFTDNIF